MTRSASHPVGFGPPLAPYSAVVVSDGLAFVSGQVPVDRDGRIVVGSFAEQLGQVRENLEACLAAAGCSMADVQKVTVYLEREEDFDDFNAEYVSWFTSPLPARTAIRAHLMKGFLVEIEAIARLPRA